MFLKLIHLDLHGHLHKYVVDNNIDVINHQGNMAKPGTESVKTITSLCPTGYKLHHQQRKIKGWSTGRLHKTSLNINLSKLNILHPLSIHNYCFKQSSIMLACGRNTNYGKCIHIYKIEFLYFTPVWPAQEGANSLAYGDTEHCHKACY